MLQCIKETSIKKALAMSILEEPISLTVWDNKYRYRRDGKVIDQAIEQTWQRVAKAVAYAEKRTERGKWQKAFYQILEGFSFLPGGRILAGAGTTHKVTLSHLILCQGYLMHCKKAHSLCSKGGEWVMIFLFCALMGRRLKKQAFQLQGLFLLCVFGTRCAAFCCPLAPVAAQ
jgi:hypothetical protein